MKKRICAIIMMGSLASCLCLTACGKVSQNADTADLDEKKIGIIAALDYEMEILTENMEDLQTEVIAGTEYYSGTIGDYQVVCMKCGMGKVSAALGAQAMISEYQPDVIINTGCAGAISPDLEVGDIVLADTTVEWDLDTIDLGNPRGYVSAMDQVEMHPDKTITDELAAVIGEKAEVKRGMIASGDQFVSSQEQRDIILDAFPEALCVEMEGGAIGHVCEQNGVPFCVIRSMSDNANGDSGVDFAEFSKEAGKKSAAYLLEYLENE